MAHHLQAKDKRKILTLYLSGVKPEEIAKRMAMKPASLRQHLYREGLTKRRGEMVEMKERTAREVLERVRKEGVEDFGEVIREVSGGLRIDAQKLSNGWHLVDDAAGASSLMRAKNLHLDRALRLFGVAQSADDLRGDDKGRGIIFVNLERVRPTYPVRAAQEIEGEDRHVAE